MRGTWQKALESGTVVVVLQTVPKAFADLPGVPLAIDLAKTVEAKQLIEYGIHYPSKITKTLALPPGTPNERAQILQKALQETVKDPEFIGEADKAKIGLAPVTSEDMRKTVEGIFKLDTGLVAKLSPDAVSAAGDMIMPERSASTAVNGANGVFILMETVAGSTTSTLSTLLSSLVRAEPVSVRCRSIDVLTAAASSAVPSANFAPCRTLMVTVSPSAENSGRAAASCGTMTSLLSTS